MGSWAQAMLLVALLFPAFVESKIHHYKFSYKLAASLVQKLLMMITANAIVNLSCYAEWWKADVEAVVNQYTQTGMPPNVSDAHTINGYPGPVPNCSSKGYTLHVDGGKTYLLRIINAALNDELFFKIAGHNLTVVEVDASYTKPFQTDTIFIGPGQTTNAILATDKATGKYLITISPFMDTTVAVNNITAFAFLRYNGTPAFPPTTLTSIPPINATAVTTKFINSLRSLNSKQYPAKVPLTIDHSLFFTIGVGVNPCATCVNGSRVIAAVNNVTFIMPTTNNVSTFHSNASAIRICAEIRIWVVGTQMARRAKG
ncbi:hypothetical protein HS088_TW13G01373 [Tripterygium wilfordii]|uniref:laccase n=1 Tax=Tripterygium wilfordii TaxID=458696 RepID=A0A7J7CWS6_TRIWF|nr:hypothetical protein HS088_TW13G01373 [Tripterygium wilfordii]